ncbi:MAG: thiamine-phosphate kinase [Microterricola sp.]
MTHAEHPSFDPAGPTLAELSEIAVLQRIFPRLPESDATLVGPGDDAAVIAAPDGRYVVTTDMMIHGPDFRLAWSRPGDLGWKAAATNLSDVAAMGARPTALVVAIAAPQTLPVSVIEGIADGLREACAALAPGCGVVGGDLSASETLTIAVTAFGDLGGHAPVLRSGARPGDLVAIAEGGNALGEAGRGLALLFTRGVDADGAPDAAAAASLRLEHPRLLGAQLRPAPPIAAGALAAASGASAMLDVSDGLALDAARISVASGVRIDFDSAELGEHPESALGGGEDHSLLACFPHDATIPAEFRVIGRVHALSGDETAGITVDGAPHVLGGWDPYRGWDGHAG